MLNVARGLSLHDWSCAEDAESAGPNDEDVTGHWRDLVGEKREVLSFGEDGQGFAERGPVSNHEDRQSASLEDDAERCHGIPGKFRKDTAPLGIELLAVPSWLQNSPFQLSGNSFMTPSRAFRRCWEEAPVGRIVLTADYTLMTDYRNLSLSPFFSCIPADYLISRSVFRLLAPNPPHRNGEAVYAPYGLRKFEAALLADGFKREEIVVAHPDHVHRFVGPETEVVGINTMDPLGLGPVSMTFTNGGRLTAFTKAMFDKVLGLLPRENGHKFKVVVGGPGAWQLKIRPQEREARAIDHIVMGECDTRAGGVMREIIADGAPDVIEVHGFPDPSEMPPIVGPAMHGMVEAMRGCGRNCEFCEVNLRRARYLPLPYIQQEIGVNARAGLSNAWLHSDDIFLYECEDRHTLRPNHEAIVELFRAAMAVPGIAHCNPTHGSLSPVAADPQLVAKIAGIVRTDPRRWVGIQSGLETGSGQLMRTYMPRKMLPYSPDEWGRVVLESLEILNRNYWYPALTLILGLPGETAEDAWETVELINRMEAIPNNHFIVAPLSFVPVGILKGEEFYHIDSMIDEARFNVLYRCWKHILHEIDHTLWSISRSPLPVRVATSLVGAVGGRFLLRLLERYGQRRGFSVKSFHARSSSRGALPA